VAVDLFHPSTDNMTDRKQPDHWASLASLLGAEVPPEPEPAEAVPTETERGEPSPETVADPETAGDWLSPAIESVESFMAPAVEEPAFAEPVEEAAPRQPKETPPAVERVRSRPPRPASSWEQLASELGVEVTIPPPPPSQVWEPEPPAPAVMADTLSHAAKGLSQFAGELADLVEDAADAAETSEAPEARGGRRRRKRRRRGRGTGEARTDQALAQFPAEVSGDAGQTDEDRGGADEGSFTEPEPFAAHDSFDADEPFGVEEPTSEAAEAIEEAEEAIEEGDEDFMEASEAQPSEKRSRRRRRRRGRRDGQQPAEAEERPAPSRDLDADDDFDEDHDGPPGRMGFRNIPTWGDAVGTIIAKNLESRSRSPGNGGRGNRGRGRGGRRHSERR
jgi:hypothetical protein